MPLAIAGTGYGVIGILVIACWSFSSCTSCAERSNGTRAPSWCPLKRPLIVYAIISVRSSRDRAVETCRENTERLIDRKHGGSRVRELPAKVEDLASHEPNPVACRGRGRFR